MLRKIGSGLSALVLAAACASAPKKEPEVIFLDVSDAISYFRQKYGCVGVAVASDEPSYDTAEAAVKNYKKWCSSDISKVRTVAYQDTHAIAFKEHETVNE